MDLEQFAKMSGVKLVECDKSWGDSASSGSFCTSGNRIKEKAKCIPSNHRRD